MLLKKRWNRIDKLKNNIHNITVTADSHIKDTYEVLRRGGKYEDLIENLQFIAELKETLQLKFHMRMVVQRANADQITGFYHWAKAIGADEVEYTRITDWYTYSKEQFTSIDVLDPQHELYASTIDQIQQLRSQFDNITLYGFNN